MGYFTHGIPKDIVKQIVNEIKIYNFVETGTYFGDTTFWAASIFDNVFTIEIDSEMSEKATNRLKNIKNIKFLTGDSHKILPDLLQKIAGSTLFWLDGHYSGPGTGGVDFECPVMHEIEAISVLHEPIIFIDDARLFMGPLPEPHKSNQWPRIDEIFHALWINFPNHSTTIHDDVIICVPKEVRKIIDIDWKNKYYYRFPIKNNSSFIYKLTEKISDMFNK